MAEAAKMTTGQVAAVLDVSTQHVRAALDDELKPTRMSDGRRYYDRRLVMAFARKFARRQRRGKR